MKSLNVNGIHLSNVKPLQVMRNFVGPWCNGTRCGMRIPRPGFNSQQIIPPNQDSPVNWNSPSPCELLLRRMSSLLTQRRYMDVGTTLCASYWVIMDVLLLLITWESISTQLIFTFLTQESWCYRNSDLANVILMSVCWYCCRCWCHSSSSLSSCLRWSTPNGNGINWRKVTGKLYDNLYQGTFFQISNLYNLDTHNMHYL